MSEVDSNKIIIAALTGDGVGPEIIFRAIDILKITQEELPVSFDIDFIECGGRYYLTHEKEWPDDASDRCARAHAVLLGAVGHVVNGKPVMTRPGHPYPDSRIAGYAPVIGTRQSLGLYANVRPVKKLSGVKSKIMTQLTDIWGQGEFDYVIVRENTEDAYTGKSVITDDRVQTRIEITRDATYRIARFAFDLARKRGQKKRVTCVDKSNIIAAHAFFREQVARVGKEAYPDINLTFAYADSFCLSQLQNPDKFDVVVCPNFVGDIVSDAAALIMGGLGMAPSANLGENHAMFEPIHGSAPDLFGLDQVNPVGMILSVGMMFDWLYDRTGNFLLKPLSTFLKQAIQICFKKNLFTRDLAVHSWIGTRAMGEAIAVEYQSLLIQWKGEDFHGHPK
ncbi:MAG: isocitrate/isopropylmalate dehydrogenase family protein [Proteobacteria bacterium]|nr:isocitrate/isopropylmalate dehydrogenase family protein [Pseudomonadota bacterium]